MLLSISTIFTAKLISSAKSTRQTTLKMCPTCAPSSSTRAALAKHPKHFRIWFRKWDLKCTQQLKQATASSAITTRNDPQFSTVSSGTRKPTIGMKSMAVYSLGVFSSITYIYQYASISIKPNPPSSFPLDLCKNSQRIYKYAQRAATPRIISRNALVSMLLDGLSPIQVICSFYGLVCICDSDEVWNKLQTVAEQTSYFLPPIPFLDRETSPQANVPPINHKIVFASKTGQIQLAHKGHFPDRNHSKTKQNAEIRKTASGGRWRGSENDRWTSGADLLILNCRWG